MRGFFGPLSRYMLALSVVPAVLQFIGFIFLPESPRWLLQSGRTEEAHDVLRQIRGGQSVDVEYESIKTSIEDEEREAGAGERSVTTRMRCRYTSCDFQPCAVLHV